MLSCNKFYNLGLGLYTHLTAGSASKTLINRRSGYSIFEVLLPKLPYFAVARQILFNTDKGN